MNKKFKVTLQDGSVHYADAWNFSMVERDARFIDVCGNSVGFYCEVRSIALLPNAVLIEVRLDENAGSATKNQAKKAR